MDRFKLGIFVRLASLELSHKNPKLKSSSYLARLMGGTKMLLSIFRTLVLLIIIIAPSKNTWALGDDAVLALVDWGKYYTELLTMCNEKYPDSVNELRKRINMWHSNNDEIISEIIKTFKNDQDFGNGKLKKYQKRFTDLTFTRLLIMEGEELKENCFGNAPYGDFDDLLENIKYDNNKK